MDKRYIKKLDMYLPPLGIGISRLNLDGENLSQEAFDTVDYAMECGANYFDTAYFYQHNQSERYINELLVKRFQRDDYFIADKLPTWMCKSQDDMEKIFATQLTRLGVDYIDFYMLHALQEERWIEAHNLGVLDFLDRKIREGKIRKIGFSFHDYFSLFKDIQKAYEWDFVQLQINYYDWNKHEVDKCYYYADEKDIPCFVMQPVGGGRLSNLPKDAEQLLRKRNPEASISSWAIRYVASLQNVAVILSGISNIDQLSDNLKSLSPIVPLAGGDIDIINEVVEILSSYTTIPCIYCNYCSDVCPMSIDVPMIFKLYNDSEMFEESALWEVEYFEKIPSEKSMKKCTSCNICVKSCPQAIDIPEQFNILSNVLSNILCGIDIDKLSQTLKGFDLVLFGAGNRASITTQFLEQYGFRISYVCDNAEHLWNREKDGTPIISPAQLIELRKAYNVKIIIAVAAFEAVKNQLVNIGVCENDIYSRRQVL